MQHTVIDAARLFREACGYAEEWLDLSAVRFCQRLLLCLLLGGTIAAAQEAFAPDDGAEAAFVRALHLYRQGDFAGAARAFDSLALRTPVSQRTTAAYIMAAKAKFRTGAYRESAEDLASMLKRLPESSYAGDARFQLGLDYMMLRYDADAALQFAKSLELTHDTAAYARAVRLFEEVADRRLAARDLENMVPQIRSIGSRDLVLLKLAEKYAAAGESHRAAETLREPLSRGSMYAERMRLLFNTKGATGSLKLGVALPLMKRSGPGPLQDIARDLLDGMSFALNRAKKLDPHAPVVTLDVRDTERDSALTVRTVGELAADPDVVAIVGPLFSNLATASARTADAAGVPLLTPTAEADGIAAAGDHLFQLSPDYSVRGRAMARYAVGGLGLTVLAVMSPEGTAGKAMGESFAREAARLGATVVAQVAYPAGVTDLRDQFTQIRSAGLQHAGSHERAENADVPVDDIQGIFFPIADGDEIGVIAPQLKFFNINTQILGGSAWDDPAKLDEQRRYAEGAIFLADVPPEADPITRELAAAMNRDATKYALIGYDTMSLLLGKLASGATSRQTLTAALSGVEHFRGTRGPITLRRTRVNSEVSILKYARGAVVRLTEVDVQ